MQQVAVFSMAVDPRVSEELKHHWRRFVVLGAALIVLGVVALGVVSFASAAARVNPSAATVTNPVIPFILFPSSGWFVFFEQRACSMTHFASAVP